MWDPDLTVHEIFNGNFSKAAEFASVAVSKFSVINHTNTLAYMKDVTCHVVESFGQISGKVSVILSCPE